MANNWRKYQFGLASLSDNNGEFSELTDSFDDNINDSFTDKETQFDVSKVDKKSITSTMTDKETIINVNIFTDKETVIKQPTIFTEKSTVVNSTIYNDR